MKTILYMTVIITLLSITGCVFPEGHGDGERHEERGDHYEHHDHDDDHHADHDDHH